jgi:hypothetical protein
MRLILSILRSLPLAGELDNRTDELHETITEAEQGHDDVKWDGTTGQHEGGGEGDHAKDDEDGAEDHLQDGEVLDVVCHREDIQFMGLNKFLKKRKEGLENQGWGYHESQQHENGKHHKHRHDLQEVSTGLFVPLFHAFRYEEEKPDDREDYQHYCGKG